MDWIDRLLVGGFERYTKDTWMAWSDAMIRIDDEEAQTWAAQRGEMYGPSGGAPVPGVRGDVLRRLETIFTATGGDATAIAAACPGCSAESITRNPPAGAADSAIMFLSLIHI